MGKPFATELARLVETLDWVQSLDISTIEDFFFKAAGCPLVAIGAGGSFTAAEMSRLLFESRGEVAVAHTPLSFLQSRSNLRGANILLFTAGGNNRDVLACYDAAVKREANAILVVCGMPGSKLEQQTAGRPKRKFFTLCLPAGRDGYLATNSLVAFCAVVIRAFGYCLPSRKTISRITTAQEKEWMLDAKEVVSPFYLAIYGEWGRPAVVDLESKFSEAGLGGVMLADFRNFAHGRHNWIDKKGAESTVLCFITPESSELAEKTLCLLPASTRILKFKTNTPGPTGSLELLIQIFRFAAFIGTRRGIDPGRPGVPPYGSHLYRLGPVVYSRIRRIDPAQLQTAAVNRKQSARGSLSDNRDHIRIGRGLTSFTERLESAYFGALVVDFDGTVARSGKAEGLLDPSVTSFLTKVLKCNARIYFATGRGDSIHSILKASFAEALWDRIFVSYYNGVLTLPLAEWSRFADDALPTSHALDRVFKIIQKDRFLRDSSESKHKRCQVTVKVGTSANTSAVAVVINDIVSMHARTELRVVYSSHSIDIIPIERTKLDSVRFAQSRLANSLEVLTIGDRGAIPGNDFDLLTHPFSLSVDTVSTDLNSCWNLLPPGICNVPGFIHYMSWARFISGHFTLRIPH